MSSAAQYAERINLIAAAEEFGFYGYHVAEHHLSPLSMAPSPLLFLSAVSQRTTRIRIGPMVLILPLYLPIRLAQEICMLDALSSGRLETGVGRGVRDVEHEWFGHDPTTTRDQFDAALQLIRDALSSGQVALSHPECRVAPLVHEPTQEQAPRFWYVGNMEYAAEQGMSVLAHRPTQTEVDQFCSTWDKLRTDGSPLHQGLPPMVGATRPVYVARTDDEAEVVVRRAWEKLGDNFWATDTRSGGRSLQSGARLGSFGGGDYREALEAGDLLFGSPKTVTDVLKRFLTSSGPRFTYLVSGFQWGDITHREARSSLELFATDVIPSLREHHMSLTE